MKELDKLFTDGQMNIVTRCNLCHASITSSINTRLRNPFIFQIL